MSSNIEELPSLVLGKGINMRTFIDHSQPKDSPKYNWVDTTYDGKEVSDLLSIPLHWHRYEHDEIMEVLEGRMIFYLDGKELVTSAGDPPILIPRLHVHGFTAIKGERVRFTERTQPSGTFKAHFFQDLFQNGPPSIPRVMRVFYDGDTFVSLPGGFKWLDYLFITVAGGIAKLFVAQKPAELRRGI